MREDFETTTQRGDGSSPNPAAGFFRRYATQILVSVLVVAVLAGGAYYASRISEQAPKVVYSAALDDIEAEERGTGKININTADAEDLEGLPGVGPATAESIIQHRRANGRFGSVEELEEVPGIGPKTLEEIEPLAET